MKKYIFICLLLCSLLLVGCSSNKVSIGEYDKYIGTWVLDEVGEYEGFKVIDSYFEFNKDGSCFFSLTIDSAIAVEGTSDGNCYLNSSKNKFLMDGKDSIFKEWTSFSEDGDYLIINNWKYKKVDD